MRALQLRHAVLLGILFVTAVLLRADERVPTNARIPGLIILGLFALFLALPRRRAPRASRI
jgi:hypothetical protein